MAMASHPSVTGFRDLRLTGHFHCYCHLPRNPELDSEQSLVHDFCRCEEIIKTVTLHFVQFDIRIKKSDSQLFLLLESPESVTKRTDSISILSSADGEGEFTGGEDPETRAHRLSVPHHEGISKPHYRGFAIPTIAEDKGYNLFLAPGTSLKKLLPLIVNYFFSGLIFICLVD